MKKIDSLLLVCSAAQSQKLLSLGILPVACNCYESIAGQWEFAGEFFDQQPVLPAWTMEELNILIGGDFPQVIKNEGKAGMIIKYPKPDLYRTTDWTQGANMMKYILYLPFKRAEFLNGAEALAVMLEQLLVTKELTAAECNARLEAFTTKAFFNPYTEQLHQEAKNKRR